MQLGTLRRASRRQPVPQQLLPGRLRWTAAALLAACVAVPAVLAIFLAGRGKPGGLDSAIDPRIEAGLARFPRDRSGSGLRAYPRPGDNSSAASTSGAI
jgi:hypothetical protein